MLESFLTSIIFWPIFTAIAFIILFLTKWKELHISQKLFAGVLVTIIPYLTTIVIVALGHSESWKGLLLGLDSFFSPLFVVLSTLLLYTHIRATRPNRKSNFLFLIPFGLFGLHLLTYYGLDQTKPAWAVMEVVYITLHAILVYAGDVALLVYALYQAITLKRNMNKYISGGDENAKEILRLTIHMFILYFWVQIPLTAAALFPSSIGMTSTLIWSLIHTPYAIYVCYQVLRGVHRPSVDGQWMSYAEEKKEVLLEVMADEVLPSEQADEVTDQAQESQPTAEELAKIRRFRYIERYAEESNLKGRLENIMIKKKMYLQQNLTIRDVADLLGTNHAYLSIYLNEMQGVNFSDYVNKLRLEREVFPRLKENPQVSTQELVFASGFSNTATFYRVFQRMMGVSYPQYRKQTNKE